MKSELNIGDIANNWKIIDKNYSVLKNRMLYDVECLNCGLIKESVATSGLRLVNNCNRHNSKMLLIKDKHIRHIFENMILRCYNKKEKSYKQYGGKGIKICEEWMSNPNKFEEWSLLNGYKEGLSIDRPDSSKDYSPDNCRWISREENSKWKSTTNSFTVNNITDSGRGWSKRLGLGINFINRYNRKYGKDKTVNFIRKSLISN